MAKRLSGAGVFFTVALFAGQALAAPNIQSVQAVGGTFGNNSIITVQGSGFGAKNPVGPVLYDHISNVSAYAPVHGAVVPVKSSGCSGCPWAGWGPYGMQPQFYLSGDVRVSGQPMYYVNRHGYFRSPEPIVSGLTESDKVFVSWWIRANHTLYSTSNGAVFNKLIRWATDFGYCGIYSGVYVEPQGTWTNIDHCFTCNSSANCGECYDASAGDGGGFVLYASSVDIANQWNHIEIALNGGGDLSKGTGQLKVFFNHALQAQTNTVYSCRGLHDFVERWGSDPNTPESYPENSQILFGEFYFDRTWARIVICDSSVWSTSSAGHCEIQEPVSTWGNAQLQFKAYQGSFDGEQLYLYVIDAEGNVSNGYPVMFGTSGDQLAPAAPGNLHVG